jgi:hypothetical protein
MRPWWERESDRPVPEPVRESLRKAYGHDKALLSQAFASLRWDGLNGCWCLAHAGMYIGIEESDGYMHT